MCRAVMEALRGHADLALNVARYVLPKFKVALSLPTRTARRNMVSAAIHVTARCGELLLRQGVENGEVTSGIRHGRIGVRRRAVNGKDGMARARGTSICNSRSISPGGRQPGRAQVLVEWPR